MRPVVKVKRLAPEAVLPTYAHDGDAGMDLCAILPDSGLLLWPGDYVTIATGIAVAIPPGYEGQVRPRSGMASRRGLTVLNAPGTIDSTYRGEVGVILYNASAAMATVKCGERIAQLVIAPVATAQLVAVDELDETERGEGGFGSTGE